MIKMIVLKDNMCKYNYKILNYWKDLDDLYVNYVVEDAGSIANAITSYKIYEISNNYNELTSKEVNNQLLELIRNNNGVEFTFPKVSEISPLLRYIYDFVCESESNMCHIDYNDWEELKEENNFSNEDIDYLSKEIKKYNLGDYITIAEDEYKICGYGGLQCCFNDDREKGNIELQR